jgi:hypothetical protein
MRIESCFQPWTTCSEEFHMRISLAVTAAAAVLALAGCQRTAVAPMASPAPTTAAPLTPAPIGGVQGSQLPPPSPDQFPTAPTAPENTGPSPEEMAAVSANAPEVSRQALLGTWQTSVSGGSCQLALSLTQWTGGYRAASLRCPGAAANIASWDVSGNQVVLNDRDGNNVARLYQSAPERYDGTLSSGGSISLSR